MLYLIFFFPLPCSFFKSSFYLLPVLYLLQSRLLSSIRETNSSSSKGFEGVQRAQNIKKKKSKDLILLPTFLSAGISGSSASLATSPLFVPSMVMNLQSNSLSASTVKSSGNILNSNLFPSRPLRLPPWSSPQSNSPHSNSPYRNSPHSNSPHSNGPHSNGPYRNSPHSNSPHNNSPHSNSPRQGRSLRDGLSISTPKQGHLLGMDSVKRYTGGDRHLYGTADDGNETLILSDFSENFEFGETVEPSQCLFAQENESTSSMAEVYIPLNITCIRSGSKSPNLSENCYNRVCSPSPSTSPLRNRQHRTRKTFCVKSIGSEDVGELSLPHEYSAEELKELSFQEQESREIKKLICQLRSGGEVALQDINIDLNEKHQNVHENEKEIVKSGRDEIGNKGKNNLRISSLSLARMKAFGITDVETKKTKKEEHSRCMLDNQKYFLSPYSQRKNETSYCNVTGFEIGVRDQDESKNAKFSIKIQSDEILDEKCHLTDFICLPRTETATDVNKSNAEGEKQDVGVFSSHAIHTVKKSSPNVSPTSSLNLFPIRSPSTSPGPSPVLTPRLLPLLFPGLSLPSISQISKSRSTTPVNKKNENIK